MPQIDLNQDWFLMDAKQTQRILFQIFLDLI
jgi:hypothetical protein